MINAVEVQANDSLAFSSKRGKAAISSKINGGVYTILVRQTVNANTEDA